MAKFLPEKRNGRHVGSVGLKDLLEDNNIQYAFKSCIKFSKSCSHLNNDKLGW